MITVTCWHEISCGHRVAGHESKGANLHGHNYGMLPTRLTVVKIVVQETDKCNAEVTK